MNLGMALTALFSFYVVKMSGTVVAIILANRFYKISHSTMPSKAWLFVPNEERADFKLLTWGLILYTLSEIVCGVEIYIIAQSFLPLAIIHTILSLSASSLVFAGMFQLVDKKFLFFLNHKRPCIGMRACGTCTMRAGQTCKFNGTLMVLITLLIFLTIPIMFTSTEKIPASPKDFMLPFEGLNIWFDTTVIPWVKTQIPSLQTDVTAYYIPSGMLYFEFRIIPALIIISSLINLYFAWAGKERIAVWLFLVNVGAYAYILFEVMIFALPQKALLGSLMHESGELFVLFFLWEFVRHVFGIKEAAVAPAK